MEDLSQAMKYPPLSCTGEIAGPSWHRFRGLEVGSLQPPWTTLSFWLNFNHFILPLFCNMDSLGGYPNEIIRYDPARNGWKDASNNAAWKMTTPRWGHSVAPRNEVSDFCG